MVRVFPRIFPASIEVAPYSPIALAKDSTPPEYSPGAALGRITLKNIEDSLIPRVRPAYIKFTSVCSNAALALLYISGKAITAAAVMQPSCVCTSFMPNSSNSILPSGLLRLNSKSSKYPAAVGGSTSGMVSTLSAIHLARSGRRIAPYAAAVPIKNIIHVEISPVLSVI